MATGPAWLNHPDLRAADAVVLDSIAAAPAAPWLKRVSAPIIGMLHQPPGGMEGSALARAVRTPLDRSAYRQMALLMVASDWLADQLVAIGVSRRRIRVIVPGKDLEPDGLGLAGAEASPQLRERLRAGRRIAAVCVANWLPRKGIVELLEALGGVEPHLITLHLIGNTESDPRYARRVKARMSRPDVAGRVVVHGLVAPERLAAIYRAADIFVLPSFEEPYGTVWGEAMAARLPVVGWHAGNLPYLAEHKREGLLAPVGDVQELRRALEQVALDPDLRERMAAAAAARAAARPTWDETATQFFAVIEQVTRQGAIGPQRPTPRSTREP